MLLAATVTAVATELPTCYKHPDQPAGVICQRCDRPICPRCMNQASVGFHCPECARGGAQQVYRGPAAVGGSTRAVVTRLLVAVNVAVFVLGLVLRFPNQSVGDALANGSTRLLYDGGLAAPFVATGDWWRVFSAGFLHIGFIHLGFNMYALWWLGHEIERAFGWAKMLAIYVVSLLAGSLGALILSPNSLTAGASGAIYGLLGAIVAVYRSRGVRVQDTPIFGILVINFIFTAVLASHISVGGHIGGFIGGFVAGYALFDLPLKRRDLPAVAPWLICGALGAVCLVASLIVSSSHGVGG
ncbi:MAG: rhomboid family intrarane serine protease [Acidimicrobiales bacterium]|nr:rhomboid family intrarane serine protease [Acidimicrobiales bacterium]